MASQKKSGSMPRAEAQFVLTWQTAPTRHSIPPGWPRSSFLAAVAHFTKALRATTLKAMQAYNRVLLRVLLFALLGMVFEVFFTDLGALLHGKIGRGPATRRC